MPLYDVELDAVDQRGPVDGAGMRGALSQRFEIAFTRTCNVIFRYCSERQQLDRVDLAVEAVTRVPTAGFRPG